MPRLITTVLQALAGRRRARRRLANLRAGASDASRKAGARGDAGTGTGADAGAGAAGEPRGGARALRRPSAVTLAVLALLPALAGGLLIAGHARHLAAATVGTPQAVNDARVAAIYQSVLPGIAFTVPARPGIGVALQPGGALLVAAGVRAAPAVRVDLCGQVRGPADARLLPLRLGYRFEDVERWVARGEESNAQVALRNVLLVADSGTGAEAMPEVRIEGSARADFTDPASEPLRLSWRSQGASARWISDASFGQVEQGASGQVALRQQGWLLWGASSALRIERRTSVLCPRAGELVLRIFRHAGGAGGEGEMPAGTRDNAGDGAVPAGALVTAALVTAFPARGKAVGAWLAAGSYQVPAAAPAALEDQALFQQLLEQGLVRLNAAGAVDVAPRDLLLWMAAGAAERVGELDDWRQVKPGAATQKLFKRLYYQADGAYVRQQIDIYNSERRLLAWRWRDDVSSAAMAWSAGAAGAPGDAAAGAGPAGESSGVSTATAMDAAGSAPAMVATTSQMPVAASRLFAALPQGWRPWTRVARWPRSGPARDGRPLVRLTLTLPKPAAGGEVLHLMLAGRLAGQSPATREVAAAAVDAASAVAGASVRAAPACTGRACATAADVQELALTLRPGARSVRLDVQPLDFNTPEDQQYRHLRVTGGRITWQALAPAAAAGDGGNAGDGAARPASPSPVRLEDRNGAVLWADGAPSEAAMRAGLAPLLGVGADHANSVAGMLARLPLSAATRLAAAPPAATPPVAIQMGATQADSTPPTATTAASGAAVGARLTLDLPLQTLSQHILDCVGMRRGRWDGKARSCAGGQAAPEGRHAGMVILDTETGDILAAAGGGGGAVDAANWAEVRDFDRTSPARSPLRLPAWQHDGGAHQSPGSTFKVISALGLEMAARGDTQIDALLDGMPLPAINRLARQRGYGFQTDAASYPFNPSNPRLARITNYHEQSADRRAQEGRLGLVQALTYSLNTWFAWSGELSDRSLFGRPDGGAPDLQALDAGALDAIRPIVAAAHRLGFEQALRLDGGLLPADFNWRGWDALRTTPAHIDTIHTRHELRQMAIGLRMQATPLQMALASAAIGQGGTVTPRLLLALGPTGSAVAPIKPLGVRLDRIRAGMKGVVDVGTGAGAFGGAALAGVRPGLYGKTGTAPSGEQSATVWFTGWLEPGSLPGQTHRLALAAFASHSDATGGEHAAPMVAAVLATLARPR